MMHSYFEVKSRSTSSFHFYQLIPVTFVPMTRCSGISFGSSLIELNSVVFLCWSWRILSLRSSRTALSSAKKAGEHLLGFPISLRILFHSTRLIFLHLSSGKDSLKQILKSFSPRNSGLKKEGKRLQQCKEPGKMEENYPYSHLPKQCS